MPKFYPPGADTSADFGRHEMAASVATSGVAAPRVPRAFKVSRGIKSASVHPRRTAPPSTRVRAFEDQTAPTTAELPPTDAIAKDGVEGYVAVLEAAYGDESLGNAVRDRMADDRQFSIGIRGAMQDPKYAERLKAAIDSSPYMQAAVAEATRRRQESDAVQAVMGDDSVQGQLAQMSSNPELLRQTQEQSETLLRKVAVELADGVREYREEFEPDADDLIAKFGEIAEKGYESFVRIAMADVKVKNAVINALLDEMEEAQGTSARDGARDEDGDGLIRETDE